MKAEANSGREMGDWHDGELCGVRRGVLSMGNCASEKRRAPAKSALFSCNPMPQQPKQLSIKYEIPGHDAEKTANSEEVTPAGFQRNFMRTNRGKYVLEVDYVPGGAEEAILETDFELEAPNVLPIIEIGNASYGHPTDPKKMFDVTPEVRRVVTNAGGYRIFIDKKESMWHLFNDPARGIRKKLHIYYRVRGYMGNVRIRTKFGKLLGTGPNRASPPG